MTRVIIKRRWADGTAYWDGERWTASKHGAHVYQDSTTCPRKLPLQDGRMMTRRLHRYWRRGFCWATIEEAPPVTFALTHPPRAGEGDRDIRYTPAWCVEDLLGEMPPPSPLLNDWVRILDPAAGDGAILRVLRDHGHSVQAVEIREEEREGLSLLGPTRIGDWLELHGLYLHQPIITNPPYSIGVAFLRCCMATCPPYCAALLRLNHLGSVSWVRFWQEHPPTGMIILGTRRPSFSADGKTDASEYFWAVWCDGPKVMRWT